MGIEVIAVTSAYFVFVFFKAVQQRNVMGLHYKWVMPVSYAMSATEVFMIAAVAYRATHMEHWTELLPFVLGIGTGGGLGAMCGMYLHNKHITQRIIAPR